MTEYQTKAKAIADAMQEDVHKAIDMCKSVRDRMYTLREVLKKEYNGECFGFVIRGKINESIALLEGIDLCTAILDDMDSLLDRIEVAGHIADDGL